MTGPRHVARLPGGGIALSPRACLALLPLLGEPGRLAGLDPIGSMAASAVGLVGRAAAARAGTGADASDPIPERDRAAPFTHADLLDAGRTALLLGCTPNNVRDLARRRRLPGERVAGRWVFRADVVHAEVRRRAG